MMGIDGLMLQDLNLLRGAYTAAMVLIWKSYCISANKRN